MRVAVEDMSTRAPEIEFHHVGRSHLVIGSGPGADLLLLDGGGIARRHTRVLARRGLLVVVDLGTRRGTQVRGESIRAPVVLAPGEPFVLDRFRFRAWPHSDEDPRPLDAFDGDAEPKEVLGDEVLSEFSDLRWFTRPRGGWLEQWAVPARALEPALLDAWTARVLASAERPSAYLPDLVGVGSVRGRPCVQERLPVHVTLAQIDDAILDGHFQPNAAFTYSLAAQLLEAVSTFHAVYGPHGALSPRAFVLGLDGRLVLRRPGPAPGDLDLERDREYLSPARRCGAPPSPMDDRFSLAALGWLGRLIPAGALAKAPLEEIARGLREGAVEAGVDPSAGQLAHIARLVYRERSAIVKNLRPLS